MLLDLKSDSTWAAFAAAALTAVVGWLTSAFSAGRKYQLVLDKLQMLDEKLIIVTEHQAKEIMETKVSVIRAHERIDTLTGT